MPLRLGLYIHVPFCRRACHYCDFFFTPRASQMEAYVEALLREVELYRPLLDAAPIETVFFGGGTPSWLPLPLWEKLWQALARLPSFSPVEVSMEANPEDLTPENLQAWIALGITRVSVGIQSFQAKVLRTLGRAHRPEKAYAALEALAQAPLRSWSADLIFAVPGQTLEDWVEDLQTLLRYDPPHLSLYGLTLEPRTVLYKKHQRGQFVPVSDEMYAQLYLAAHERLAEAGYKWYELSNWAKVGHECQHNWRYWLRQPYVGLGPSAHSYVPESRWWNPRSLSAYFQKLQAGQLPVEAIEYLTPAQVEQERWLTQLRTRVGVARTDFYSPSLAPQAQQLLTEWLHKGWLRTEGGRITLSPEGALLSDFMIKQLFSLTLSS